MTRVGFSEAYYDSYTGAQQSMLPLLTDTSGISSILLCPAAGKCTTRISPKVETHIISYPERLDRFGGHLLDQGLIGKVASGGSLLGYHFDVLRQLRKLDIDILYCNNIRALILFGPPAKLLGIPIIWYVRIDTPTSLMDKIGLFLADEIITISDGVRSRFTDDELVKYDSKIQTIYTGVDLSKFNPSQEFNSTFDFPNDRLTITQVASIHPRKGQDRLIKAISEIANEIPDFQIIFAGSTPEGQDKFKKSLCQLIEQNGLSNQVTFLGWCDEIPALLQRSDIFVLPSANEGFPRSILEASAMGVPTVATPAGGTSELIESGTTGVIVDDFNNTLASGLRRLANDSNLREQYGIAARNRVIERFSQERYVSDFEELISYY